MTQSLLNLTSTNFVDFFCPQNFLYSQIYNPSTTYSKNSVVLFGGLTYISLIDNNTNPPLPMQQPLVWNQINNYNYITDQDINQAMQMASGQIALDLIPYTRSTVDNSIIQQDAMPPVVGTPTGFTQGQIGLLYLSAHYLTESKFGSTHQGSPNHLQGSHSVDKISIQYHISEQVSKKLGLNLLSSTSYGKQYISLIASILKAKSIGGFVC